MIKLDCQNITKIISKLTQFWENEGCQIIPGYDVPCGAATFHPVTFFGSLSNKPIKYAYNQLIRREKDIIDHKKACYSSSEYKVILARINDCIVRCRNDEDLGKIAELDKYRQEILTKIQESKLGLPVFQQFQVILRPYPENFKDLYIKSLHYLGIDDITENCFYNEPWETQTLGCFGDGYSVEIAKDKEKIEISQITIFDTVGFFNLKDKVLEIAYGVERLSQILPPPKNEKYCFWQEYNQKYEKNLRSLEQIARNAHNLNQDLEDNKKKQLESFADFDIKATDIIDIFLSSFPSMTIVNIVDLFHNNNQYKYMNIFLKTIFKLIAHKTDLIESYYERGNGFFRKENPHWLFEKTKINKIKKRAYQCCRNLTNSLYELFKTLDIKEMADFKTPPPLPLKVKKHLTKHLEPLASMLALEIREIELYEYEVNSVKSINSVDLDIYLKETYFKLWDNFNILPFVGYDALLKAIDEFNSITKITMHNGHYTSNINNKCMNILNKMSHKIAQKFLEENNITLTDNFTKMSHIEGESS